MTENIDKDALTYILSLPKGRKVLRDILSIGGFAKNPFNPDSVRLSDFNAGNLNIGIKVYTDCMLADSNLTAMMLKEQTDDNRNAAKLEQRVTDSSAVDGSTVRTDPNRSREPNAADELGIDYDRLGNRRSELDENDTVL